MIMRMNGPTLFLDRAQSLELVDAAGAVASVKTGCLWITLEDDPRDIVLCSGESWTIDRDGRTLVHAEKPSTVRLTEGVRREGDWTAPVRKLLAVVGAWWSRPVYRSPLPYY
jgi:hypothetical protein